MRNIKKGERIIIQGYKMTDGIKTVLIFAHSVDRAKEIARKYFDQPKLLTVDVVKGDVERMTLWKEGANEWKSNTHLVVG